MVRRLYEAEARGIPELNPLNIEHIFITHLHSDHIVDYPEFVFNYWWHREKPIPATEAGGGAERPLALSGPCRISRRPVPNTVSARA